MTPESLEAERNKAARDAINLLEFGAAEIVQVGVIDRRTIVPQWKAGRDFKANTAMEATANRLRKLFPEAAPEREERG